MQVVDDVVHDVINRVCAATVAIRRLRELNPDDRMSDLFYKQREIVDLTRSIAAGMPEDVLSQKID
jgi:hypothetical protein